MRENVPPCRPWTQWEFQLADIMSSYWANFIKNGDPNGEGLPNWPAADERHGWTDLGDAIAAHQGLETKQDQLMWDVINQNGNLPNA